MQVGLLTGPFRNESLEEVIEFASKNGFDALEVASGPGGGHVDFASLFINLSGGTFNSLDEARKAGAPVMAYGVFLNAVLDFLIVALVIFLVVRAANRLQKLREQPAAAPTTKECPHCLSTIPIKATRCAHCTSTLGA